MACSGLRGVAVLHVQDEDVEIHVGDQAVDMIVAVVRKEMLLGGVYGAKSVPVVVPRRKELRRLMSPHRWGGMPHRRRATR